MVDSFSLWAPGLESKDDWFGWVEGRQEIADSPESPKITFASPIATRRFSQLTKMTCWMVEHLKLDTDILFFTSVRGEIDVQYKINSAFAKDNGVMPALFTLSVFNTAPAEATILLGSKVPYSPVYSGFDNVIRNLVTVGCAPLKTGRMKSAMLIYAEERVPDEYRNNITAPILPPMCIGVKVSGPGAMDDFPGQSLCDQRSFVRYLIQNKGDVWLE